jgi:hypothetical protein
MMIHGTVVVAVHVQSGRDVVTVTLRVTPCPGFTGTLKVVRSNVQVQLVPCCTVNVCPAIVSVPFLALAGFEATVKPTVPLPFPMAPDVTVIHESLLAAVQEHPLAAATLTVGPDPPEGPAA